MGRSLDIANLFRAFGGDPQQYREFETAEAGTPAPPAAALIASEPAAPTASPSLLLQTERASPLAALEVAKETTSADLPPLSEELAQLQARRHEQDAVAALDRALSAAVPPLPARVLAIASAKGGTGKTVVAAGLALALSRLDQPVLLVELDAQHVLSALLMPKAPPAVGLANEPVAACLPIDAGFRLLPFGSLEEEALCRFEQRLLTEPQWLARRLAALDLPADTLVILDCPTGSTPLGRQALALASQVMGVTTADAAGYASLARLERQWQACAPAARHAHLLNRVDPLRPLTLDIATIVGRTRADRLLGVLPESTALEQALALGQGLYSLDDAWSTAVMQLAQALANDGPSQPSLRAQG